METPHTFTDVMKAHVGLAEYLIDRDVVRLIHIVNVPEFK